MVNVFRMKMEMFQGSTFRLEHTYVVHIWNYKCYIEHCVESVGFIPENRAHTSDVFAHDVLKHMNRAVFGKAMGNARIHTYLDL